MAIAIKFDPRGGADDMQATIEALADDMVCSYKKLEFNLWVVYGATLDEVTIWLMDEGFYFGGRGKGGDDLVLWEI